MAKADPLLQCRKDIVKASDFDRLHVIGIIEMAELRNFGVFWFQERAEFVRLCDVDRHLPAFGTQRIIFDCPPLVAPGSATQNFNMAGYRLERHDRAAVTHFIAEKISILADVGPYIENAIDIELTKNTAKVDRKIP